MPPYFLIPTVAFMTMLGSYALRNNLTDVVTMLMLGIVGYGLKELGFHPAPIVLGLILGPIAEVGLVQAMLIGQAYDNPAVMLFQNPLSKILIALTLVFLVSPYISQWLRRRRGTG